MFSVIRSAPDSVGRIIFFSLFLWSLLPPITISPAIINSLKEASMIEIELKQPQEPVVKPVFTLQFTFSQYSMLVDENPTTETGTNHHRISFQTTDLENYGLVNLMTSWKLQSDYLCAWESILWRAIETELRSIPIFVSGAAFYDSNAGCKMWYQTRYFRFLRKRREPFTETLWKPFSKIQSAACGHLLNGT